MKTIKTLQHASPRMQGINEQYKRARRFLNLARRCKKQSYIFANLIAAVYPARAIVELMLDAADRKELKVNRAEIEEKLAAELPYYYLLEKIRIHDFHRFGCLPPNKMRKTVFIGGPIKLVVNKGIAAMTIRQKGPQIILTGNSSAKLQRPLYTTDGQFYDEETGKYLTLEEILVKYLSAVPKVIDYFKTLV